MTPPGQLMMDVAMGKADVILYDPVLVENFNRDQKGKYKLVPLLDQPVSVTPTTVFTVHPDDTHLLNMLNVALNTLILNGRVDEILNSYSISKDLIYRPLRSYQE
jgi:ABC-type amino acid transport substrate-binding protein